MMTVYEVAGRIAEILSREEDLDAKVMQKWTGDLDLVRVKVDGTWTGLDIEGYIEVPSVEGRTYGGLAVGQPFRRGPLRTLVESALESGA